MLPVRGVTHAAGGGNHQTMMNRALREHMEGQVEPLEATLRRVLREVIPVEKAATRARATTQPPTSRSSASSAIAMICDRSMSDPKFVGTTFANSVVEMTMIAARHFLRSSTERPRTFDTRRGQMNSRRRPPNGSRLSCGRA